MLLYSTAVKCLEISIDENLKNQRFIKYIYEIIRYLVLFVHLSYALKEFTETPLNDFL